MAAEDASTRELVLILVQNFFLMFFIASGVGYTLRALNLIGQSQDMILFTLTFSTVWGLTGMGYAWQRESSKVQVPRMFKDFVSAFGVNESQKDALRRAMQNSMRRLFLPGVQTPSCHS